MNASSVKKFGVAIIFAVLGNTLHAQKVAFVNGSVIDGQEFLWIYKKNQAEKAPLAYKDLAAYLDLYVTFKLKVAEAKTLGLDLDTLYQQEIRGYERALKSQQKFSEPTREYNYTMNEYREGVLMFNVCEQEIWSKAQQDNQVLKAFYEKNSNNYEGRPFEEVRGQVVGDYQLQLEAAWIKDLRAKYSVKINQSALKKLVKQEMKDN